MVKRRNKQMKCSLCRKSGHNKRTCRAKPSRFSTPIEPHNVGEGFTELKNKHAQGNNPLLTANGNMNENLNIVQAYENMDTEPYSVEELETWWELKDGEYGRSPRQSCIYANLRSGIHHSRSER